MIEFTFDEQTGIIKTVGTGRWSATTVDLYFAKLAVLLTALRLQGRPVRLLTDVTGAEIQSPEIEARINAHSARLRHADDRLALVVKSNVLKAHVRDVAPTRDLALFCSLPAAELWLSAHDRALSA